MHLKLLGVVSVSLSILDHLDGIFVECVKVIRGVGYDISVDIEQFQILQYRIFEFCLQVNEFRYNRKNITHPFF
jgi:hypothetical protein